METVVRRILKLVGEAGLWKVIGRAHTWAYRASGGRIGHHSGSLANLLLTTTGRRSGQARTVTLTYMPDGDRFVLVASNGGSDRPPSWWLNLRDNPRAEVQVGNTAHTVFAHTAGPEERALLWPKVKTYNPFYRMYEELTRREIPVVVLEPARGERASADRTASP